VTIPESEAAARAATVRVELGERGYDIAVGPRLLAEAGARVAATTGARRLAVVTDETVAGLYRDTVDRSLEAAGLRRDWFVVPPGESSKSFAGLERLCEAILETRIGRDTVVVALGGGVIGDLAGFAAAVLLRGLRYVQVPTTLLAQVDSSVGGKTAIDTAHGKNLVGAFHQPRLVLADTGVLDTLPRRELLAGYAEVLKYALLGDPGFFDWLEANGRKVIAGDAGARAHAIVTSCAAKAEIVAADEREAGARALLNLGHTFGHALEAEAGYDGSLLHGEAVAIGIVLAFALSERLGLCPSADTARVRRHMADVGLPTGLPGGRAWDAGRLLDHMTRDKKARDGRATFVLVRGIGRAYVEPEVDPAEVRALLETAAAA